jgi:ankyrin repeat protein
MGKTTTVTQALPHAASYNHLDVAGQLLDKGAAIDAKDDSDRYP